MVRWVRVGAGSGVGQSDNNNCPSAWSVAYKALRFNSDSIYAHVCPRSAMIFAQFIRVTLDG